MMRFQFQISDTGNTTNCNGELGGLTGGDGFAFVIQNDASNCCGSGTDYRVYNGNVYGYDGGLGYTGLTSCLAIEFDMYYDSKNNVLFEVGKERQIEIELKSAYSKKLVLNKFCQEFEKEFDQLTYTTDSKLKIGIEILKRKNKE